MNFQAVVRAQNFKPNGDNNANFATKIRYQDSHSGCVPAVSKNFPGRTRLTIFLLQSKRDGTDIWMWFPFTVFVGLSLQSHLQGKFLVINDLQASV